MKISSAQSCINSFLKMPITLPRTINNVVQMPVDSFTKSADNFIPFNKMFPRQITNEWFNKLSAEDIEKYDKEFNSQLPLLNLGEIKYFSMYANYLEKGLKNLSKDKPFKFVSIGQSPSLFAKILELKGYNTAICPVSELGRCYGNLSLEDVAKNSDTYFNYLKNFNIDFSNLDKNKNYYFTDYTVTGTSLKNFQQILENKGISGRNIHFIGLNDIIKEADVLIEDEKIMQDIHNNYLYMQKIKNFSPIFKLPLNKLNKIEQFEKMNLGSQNNIACNTLLYWFLKH